MCLMMLSGENSRGGTSSTRCTRRALATIRSNWLSGRGSTSVASGGMTSSSLITGGNCLGGIADRIAFAMSHWRLGMGSLKASVDRFDHEGTRRDSTAPGGGENAPYNAKVIKSTHDERPSVPR